MTELQKLEAGLEYSFFDDEVAQRKTEAIIIILAQNDIGGKTMIKMTFAGNEIYGEILNTQSGKEFLSQLPASLKFEDYNSTEKISYLPKIIG